jgi:hypothetical protein
MQLFEFICTRTNEVSVIINILTEDAPLRVRNASEVFLKI